MALQQLATTSLSIPYVGIMNYSFAHFSRFVNPLRVTYIGVVAKACEIGINQLNISSSAKKIASFISYFATAYFLPMAIGNPITFQASVILAIFCLGTDAISHRIIDFALSIWNFGKEIAPKK